MSFCAPPQLLRFLSTPSARRATLRKKAYNIIRRKISIHALREEGDEQQV